MHPLRKALAALLLPCILLAAPPVPLRWTADAARPAPYVAQVFRGETVGLSAALVAYARPLDLAGASAELCWQTNGMDSAWWTAPATVASNVVSAVWTPAMDPGADECPFFLRVSAPGGVTYRANGVVRLLGSPGESPNQLPLPVERLDFATVAWTNAPWALPADIPPAPDLSAYATTSYVAEAVAAIPAPDLSAYATTGYVASLHPPFEEYASASYTRVAAEAVPASSAVVYLGDTIATVGRTSGYALRALRSAASPDGMESEADVPGSWRLVAPTPAASISSNVLYATSTPGDATVEFAPGDGSPSLRAVVSMPGDAVRTSSVWPAGEVPGSWRAGVVATNDWAQYGYTVTTSAWNGVDYVCTNRADTASLCPAWYATRPPGNAGGMMGVAPHYTLTANHCADAGPLAWPGGATTGRGVRVAVWGDLRLQRMASEVPAASRAIFLRSSVLEGLSASRLFRAPGIAHTQHGGCAPCLLEPRPSRDDLDGLSWDNGWTYIASRDEWRNETFAHLRQYSHAAHTGDSGHPVWFQLGTNAVPVGLFHWATGSGECLLSDSLLDKVDAAIRRDSGGAESLSYYTVEDLQ